MRSKTETWELASNESSKKSSSSHLSKSSTEVKLFSAMKQAKDAEEANKSV